MSLALFMIPANPLIPWRGLPSGRAKAQSGNNVLVNGDEVSKLGPGQRLMSRVMVAMELFIPQPGLLRLYQAQLHRVQGMHGPGQFGPGIGLRGKRAHLRWRGFAPVVARCGRQI